MGKQIYKKLTDAQGKKAVSLAKKGVSQQKIANKLGIAKQSVATHLIAKGAGKRATGTFWQDVKKMQDFGYTWKEARKATFGTPKWREKRAKRHGKSEWKDFKEFWADQKRQYESAQERHDALEAEMETTYFESI